MRAKVLDREDHLCQSVECTSQATVVHHVRYPKVLGDERLEWLYALCALCHDEIHRRAQSRSLRQATREVLGLPIQCKPKKRRRKGRKVRPVPLTPRAEIDREKRKKRLKLADENEALHLQQTTARGRRDRRRAFNL